MKLIFSTVTILLLSLGALGQHNFIEIESNKTLGLLSFLETSSGKVGTSRSFQEYISNALKQDQKLKVLVDSYSNLKLRYSIKRQEFPEYRNSSTTTKEFLWIAASNSKNIDDFSQRIIGFLPHQTHVQFIKILKDTENYYDELVWNKEQENTLRIQNQLHNFKDQIGDTYLKISQFYNTSWDTNIPFSIMLYPIPLQFGNTTAYQKGNVLICGFLSHSENEYKEQLGIIIHEMCHLLYKEQHPDFQHELEQWFKNSTSPYASITSSFMDEGLATALGNGWAYKQIHKNLDSKAWYNNKHINGFAHSLFPLVDQYLRDKKSLDQDFVNASIELFAKTFPKATEETAILMNSLQLFANTEKDTEIDEIADLLYNYFNMRSLSISTPMFSTKSQDKFNVSERTKLFIIDSNYEENLMALQGHFPELKIEVPINTITILRDKKSKSHVIVMNIASLSLLNNAYKTLANITYLEHGMTYNIQQ